MLSPYRVLDLTDERGFLAGKILGELGADVVKVEPPGGDPARRLPPFLHGEPGGERSLRWLAMNTSKRGIVVDLETEPGRRRLLQLAAEADVLVESAAPGTMEALGVGWEALHERNPGLVYCAITPFGRTGPYAGYRAHDLAVVAMGGNAGMTGAPDGPPTRCSAPTAWLHAAPEAVLGIAMALYARARTGRGQLVDVSMQECQLRSLLSAPGQYALTGRLGRRSGGRVGRTREIWRAKDGQVSFGLRGGPTRIPNLVATVEYMGESGMAPEWLRDYDWKSYSALTVSDEELARIEGAFGAFFATKTMGELYEEALRRRILLAPCNDAREILRQAQLRSRELFREIDYPHLGPEPGAKIEHPDFFAKASRSRIGIRCRAPRLGEHEAAPWARPRSPEALARVDETPADGAPVFQGLFQGLRMLELGAGAAGPVATKFFAEHGARVIRIESGVRPDFLRLLHVTAENRYEPDVLERAPMFVLLNPDKQSLTLNLKEPEAVEIVKRLARWADVVSENFAPGVMAKWGLDAEALRAENPRLVAVSGCLFGQTGPQRAYPGFGGQGSAIAGFNYLTGTPEGDAHGPYSTITDSLTPPYVAAAIAAALLERDRSGQGQSIDVSQIEAGVYSLSQAIVRFSANGEVEGRRGNRDEIAVPHGVYPCAGDDRWVAVAVWDDADWQRLVDAMGRPDWASEPRFATAAGRRAAEDEIDAGIADFTRRSEPHALMRELQAAGVEAGAVQTFADLQEDPQLASRDHFVDVRHAHLGEVRLERCGLRLSESPGRIERPGPLLGEHNRDVLEGILGLEPDEVDRLVERGVVA
jgi:crotonobetainyl-CoA:carnitine CoA-transferase CaiB-like acyl-CoA transferase